MEPKRRRLFVPALLLAGILVLGWTAARSGPSAAAPPSSSGRRVTFLELGSEGCKPCEAMKPVMQAVRDRYGDRVEVVFHDVKKDRSAARKWGIRLIPTQIFLKLDGTEFFRHEGYFPLEEVEGVLDRMGAGR